MNIQEALSNLDQVCADFKGTRTDHVALQQSIQVVTAATAEPPKGKVGKGKKEPDGNK